MTVESHRPPLPSWAIVTMVTMAFALGITLTLLAKRGPGATASGQDTELRHDASEPARTAHSSDGTGPLASPPASRMPQVDPQVVREEQVKVFSGFEARFREDARVDAAWAQPAERSLVEAATEDALVEQGVPVEFQARCMSRMCKVQMAFDSASAARDWSELYVVGMADAVTSVQSMLVPRSDGRTELILYGTRKGAEAMLATAQQPQATTPSAPPLVGR